MRAGRVIACVVVVSMGMNAENATGAWADNHGGQGGATPAPGNGVDVSVGAGSGSPGGDGGNGSGGSGGGGSSSPCTSYTHPEGGLPTLTTSDGQTIPAGTPGTWVDVICPAGGGAVSGNGLFFVPAGGAGPAVNPVGVAQMLRDHIPLPAPPVVMNPPASGWQYVGIPSWFWVPPSAWQPITDSLSVAGVTVTVTARPDHITYQLQNGSGGSDRVVCRSAGTPYDMGHPTLYTPSPDCGYTWTRSAAGSNDEKLGVSAVVTYATTWKATAGLGGGALAPLDGFAFSARVTVGQVQALITGGG